jgi:hypothetical protein
MIGVKLKNKLLTVNVILCIASIVLVGTVSAQSISPGVRPGMVFDYHISSYWTSADLYASIPSDLTIVNQTSHVEIRISEVNNTHVTTANICYYKDGSNTLDRGIINLYTGEVTNVFTTESYGFAAIIGANLNKGDRIHPNGEDTLTILETTTRNYESGSRTVNRVRIVSNDPESDYVGTRDLYFDKETGVLVEQIDRTETTTYPITTTQITWKINSVSNIDNWVIPEFPLLTVVPLLLIATTFAAIAYKKQTLKTKITH